MFGSYHYSIGALVIQFNEIKNFQLQRQQPAQSHQILISDQTQSVNLKVILSKLNKGNNFVN